MKKNSFALLAVFFALFTQSAVAAENFFGLKGSAYIGVDGVISRVEHRYTSGPNSPFSQPQTQKVENDGLGFGLNAGYKINKGKFFIAPEAFYEKLYNSNPDFYRSSAQQGDKIRINERVGAKLNLGYDFTEKFSAFVNYGFASVNYRQQFGSVNRFYDSRKNGDVYGLGISYKITDNLAMRLVYDVQQIKTNYDIGGDTFSGQNGDQKDSIKIKATKIGVVYNF